MVSGFNASTILSDDEFPIELLDNDKFLREVFDTLRFLENFCHKELLEKLNDMIRLGGTTTEELSSINLDKQNRNKAFTLKTLARESLKNMITKSLKNRF